MSSCQWVLLSDLDRIKYWLSVGAQPSSRVAWLLAKANLIPAEPKYLQHKGLFELNDDKTWNVAVKDDKGNVLALIPANEAKEKYPELAKDLPKPHTRPPPVWPTIDLDSELKLDASQKVRLLQKMTGIA
jgi:hypothetical protein